MYLVYLYIYVCVCICVCVCLKGILGSLALIWQPVKKKENSEFKPVEPCIKNDFVSLPARVEELLYIYTYTLKPSITAYFTEDTIMIYLSYTKWEK